MEFYSAFGNRPVRLSDATRKFAYDSLHCRYGRETAANPMVSLDHLDGFSELTDLQKYDLAIREICTHAPIRICEGEMLSGSATLGEAIRHRVPASFGGGSVFYAVSHLTTDFETVVKCGVDGIRSDVLASLEHHKGTDREPFLQGEEAPELLRLCKERGISTAVETCGYVSPALLEKAVPFVDLFLWDVKDTDDPRHLAYTGVSNKPIMENLRRVDSLGGKTRLRCILVNGVNTEEAHYTAIAELFHSLQNCEGAELLPYHPYGDSKAKAAGMASTSHPEWIPSEETVLQGKNALLSQGVPIHG